MKNLLVRVATTVALGFAFLFSLPAYAASAPVVDALSPHVSSGRVPLFVVMRVNATDVTVSNTYLDIEYWCDAGDPDGESWINGVLLGLKTFKRGPIFAHTYQTAGTRTITCWAHNNVTGLTSAPVTTNIDAQAWPNDTTTACVSSGTAPTPGTDVDCPSGAKAIGGITGHTNAFALLTSGTNCNGDTAPCDRILLKRGDTFSAAGAALMIGSGPKMVGAFGTGAKPILQTTSTADFSTIIMTSGHVSNWRLVDLDVDGNQAMGSQFRQGLSGPGGANQSLTNLTMLRIDVHNVMAGVEYHSDKFGGNPVTGSVFQDSTVKDLQGDPTSGGGIGFRFSGTQNAVLGSEFDHTVARTEHTIRMEGIATTALCHNTTSRTAVQKESISIRPITSITNEYVLVCDNKVLITTNGIGINLTAADGVADEVANVIVERNFVDDESSGSNPQPFRVNQGNGIRIRNNIATSNSSQPYFVELRKLNASVPTPNDIGVYNNSFFTTASNLTVGVINHNPSGFGLPTNVVTRNNLVYSPSGGTVVSGTMTTSTNTGDVGTITTSPSFATTPPTVYSDFYIADASYADASGTQVQGVGYDFTGCKDTGGGTSIGAFVPRSAISCISIIPAGTVFLLPFKL